jgi:hypothetical protein
MYYDAVDENLLHSTLWNYTADNTNETGDGWNDEDLSIFSEGKERAQGGWKRPYPMAAAGTLLGIEWDRGRGIFRCRYRADAAVISPTVVYLPAEYFGESPAVELRAPDKAGAECAGGPRWDYNYREQRLFAYNGGYDGEVELVVKVKG